MATARRRLANRWRPPKDPRAPFPHDSGENPVVMRYLRDRVRQTTALISGGGRVREQISESWSSDPDTRTVYWAPTHANGDPLTGNDILFLILHEGGHLSYSGGYRWPAGLLTDTEKKRYHRFVNGGEDLRIDRLTSVEYPGFVALRNEIHDKTFRIIQGQGKSFLQGLHMVDQVTLGFMAREFGFTGIDNLIDPKALQYVNDGWAAFSRAANTASTQDLSDGVWPIFEAIMKNHPFEDEEEDQQGGGQGQGQDQQGQGSGQSGQGSGSGGQSQQGDQPSQGGGQGEQGEDQKDDSQGGGGAGEQGDDGEQDGQGGGEGDDKEGEDKKDGKGKGDKGEGDDESDKGEGDQGGEQDGQQGQDQSQSQGQSKGNPEATDGDAGGETGDLKGGQAPQGGGGVGRGRNMTPHPQPYRSAHDPADDNRPGVKGNRYEQNQKLDQAHDAKGQARSQLQYDSQRERSVESNNRHSSGITEGEMTYKDFGPHTYRANNWEMAKRDNSLTIRSLARKLKSVLRHNAMDALESGKRRGRLDTHKLQRAMAGNPRVFRKRTALGAHDYSFALLFDRSGSMMGQEAQMLATGVIVAEALEEAGMHWTMVAWDDGPNIVKKMADPLDKSTKGALASFLGSVYGGTYEAPALAIARDELAKMPPGPKVLITMTDGGTSNRQQSLEIMEMLKDDNVHCIGIGIGCTPPQHYEHRLHVPNVAALSVELPKLIGSLVRKGQQ